MRMLYKLRQAWFGFTGDLQSTIFDLEANVRSLRRQRDDAEQKLADERKFCREEVQAVLIGIGRVLAQDKAYTQSEFDPERKAESDRLGEEVIKKLRAEDKARRHTLGEL